mgnify:CR=1 FL=1
MKQKSDLQIIQNQNIEPLIKIFDDETSFKIQGGVHPSAYDLLRQIYTELKKRNQVQLFYSKNS